MVIPNILAMFVFFGKYMMFVMLYDYAYGQAQSDSTKRGYMNSNGLSVDNVITFRHILGVGFNANILHHGKLLGLAIDDVIEDTKTSKKTCDIYYEWAGDTKEEMEKNARTFFHAVEQLPRVKTALGLTEIFGENIKMTPQLLLHDLVKTNQMNKKWESDVLFVIDESPHTIYSLKHEGDVAKTKQDIQKIYSKKNQQISFIYEPTSKPSPKPVKSKSHGQSLSF